MPLRGGPAHKQEQVSQLLFGETAALLEDSGGWLRVRNGYDGYEGWCSAGQVQVLEHAPVSSGPTSYTGDFINMMKINDIPMWLPLGCPLTGFQAGMARWGDLLLEYQGSSIAPAVGAATAGLLRQYAFCFLNTAYLWGGKSVFGVDCSGFTQTVFRLLGHYLPRDAWQQAETGVVVGSPEEARCGDLAFFDDPGGRVTHVGILLEQGEIIHASEKVRVDVFDASGICNRETGRRSHRLCSIRRTGIFSVSPRLGD
ncbi:C40 family peptidase [Compostibacter hankyongensis]|uniref:C40 family peptidase n=2 Tax=Compostibacter hankyongensis TaxID=1007089 RepID=A0ABP8FQV8_9BACT